MRPALPQLPLSNPPCQLQGGEFERYSRHLVLPEVGLEGQQRLKQARVLCVGAGGLGSPALMYLAAAGVGTLGIIDHDTVDASNLQRQVIHGEGTLGKPKSESARQRLAEINPTVQVEVHPYALTSSNARELVAAYDLVVDGADNFATRYLVNDICVALGKPVVWGSVYRFHGQASVFWPPHGPCYRCLYPTAPPPESSPNCAEGGVLGAVCASIGAIQATEAIKLIAGVGTPLVGQLLVYDALEMRYRRLALGRNRECRACALPGSQDLSLDYVQTCAPPPAPKEGTTEEGTPQQPSQAKTRRSARLSNSLSPVELQACLAAGEHLVLVDVREPTEYAAGHLPGALLLPRGRFVDGSAFDQLPDDQDLVLYCKSGARSAMCLGLAQQAGFERTRHLAGGIQAWHAQYGQVQTGH